MKKRVDLDFGIWELILTRGEKRGLLTERYPFLHNINVHFDRKLRELSTAKDLKILRNYLKGLPGDNRKIATDYIRRLWEGSYLEPVECGGHRERIR